MWSEKRSYVRKGRERRRSKRTRPLPRRERLVGSIPAGALRAAEVEPRRIVIIIKNIVTAAARRTPARSTKATHVLTPQADVFAGGGELRWPLWLQYSGDL